jgi:hypothetical protein
LLNFLGIFGTNAKGARGEKTRARSRTRGFSPAVTFFIANTNRSHHCSSKRPTSAFRESVTHLTHISERLPRFPPLLIATVGRVRHTDMCLVRTEVCEESGNRPLLDGVQWYASYEQIVH